MQGKKNFTPQLFVSVNLLDMVPEDNFYRKLQTELDLHFIYKATQKYYGKEGQESIDPVVFFKILLEVKLVIAITVTPKTLMFIIPVNYPNFLLF
jgi:transposase